jgi:ATP-dependent protease ClpP protease subunit
MKTLPPGAREANAALRRFELANRRQLIAMGYSVSDPPRVAGNRPGDRPNRAKAEALIYAAAVNPPIRPTPPLLRIFGPIGNRDELGRGVFADDIEATLGRSPAALEVTLLIDSGGGLVAEARKIYAALRSRRARISARVVGECSSAATIILLAADHREAVPGAHFVVHGVASVPATGGRMTAERHRSFARSLELTNIDMARFYARRCGRSEAAFRAHLAKEQKLSAAKACELGLIHAVLDPSGHAPLSAGNWKSL